MILISDIHGCYWTLRRLLAQCPKEDTHIYFLGDLVDRGPHSKQVVEYAMAENIPTVMGNHEHMMLAHFNPLDEFYSPGDWLNNGGDVALKSWGGNVPRHVLRWILNRRLYIHQDDVLLSHTGHGMNRNVLDGLWCREPNFPKDGLFRIFGHTPQEQPLITDTYACIDTGAAYGKRRDGMLTALQWPSARIIQQKYDETPSVIHVSV